MNSFGRPYDTMTTLICSIDYKIGYRKEKEQKGPSHKLLTNLLHLKYFKNIKESFVFGSKVSELNGGGYFTFKLHKFI